jgi:hypothetical protein
MPGGLRAQTTAATMMSHTSERQARGIRQMQLGGHQFAEELQGPVDKGAVPHHLPGTVRISVDIFFIYNINSKLKTRTD